MRVTPQPGQYKPVSKRNRQGIPRKLKRVSERQYDKHTATANPVSTSFLCIVGCAVVDRILQDTIIYNTKAKNLKHDE